MKKPGKPRNAENKTVKKLMPIKMLVLAKSELKKLNPKMLKQHLKDSLKKLLKLIEKICKNKTMQQPKINKIKMLLVLILSPNKMYTYILVTHV